MRDATTVDDLKRFVAEALLNGESLRFRLRAVPQGLNLASGQLPQDLLPLRRLLAPDFTFDAYCLPCGQHSTFNAIFNAAEVDAFLQSALNGGRFYRILHFGCTRVEGHEIAVALRMWSVSVPNAVNPHDLPVNVDKIGMSPSLADLQEPLNRNAAKVLGEQGRREFNRAVGGIRMALGARARDIVRTIGGRGIRLVAAGLSLGLVGSLGFTQVAGTLLFGVTAADRTTFAGMAVLLALVSLVAFSIPIRAAPRLDALAAIRRE